MAEKIERIAHSIADLLHEDENVPFLNAFELASPVSIRLNPKKNILTPDLPKIPWTDHGYYLPERPVFTLDPLLHAGAYYVQEPGSMFIAQLLKQVRKKEHTNFLDLCAAPGGKSSLLSDFLSDQDVLVCNEISKPRLSALRENLIKYGNPNIIISNNDSRDFKKLQGFFDIILVDAPCSGEGMIRKDPKALSEWSEENVEQCVLRQQSILENTWQTLKPGGILIYSTCTFNKKENEDQLKFLNENYGAENVSIQLLPHWNILVTETNGIKAYRFFPHKLSSEGFFVAVMRKPEDEHFLAPIHKIKYPSKTLHQDQLYFELSTWIRNADEYKFLIEKQKVTAIHQSIFERYEQLKERINIVHVGCDLAEIKGEDLIPAHSLAVSTLLNRENFNEVDVDQKKALKYLHRDTIKTEAPAGWNLIVFDDRPLGWIKQIESRSNNYYPKEWRILMKLPD